MEEQGAVMEAPAAQTLEALVQAKERDAEAFQEALAELWTLRQTGDLPRERYVDVLYNEDQLRVTLQQLDQLRPQLLFAQAEDAVLTAKAHHDRYCAPVAEAGLRVCQRYRAFMEACEMFVDLVDEQVSPLVLLPAANGQPAFELDDGAMTLQHMLAIFPGQPAQLTPSVLQHLRTAMTVGEREAIMAHVKGQTPFSETNVRRFLAGYRPEVPGASE